MIRTLVARRLRGLTLRKGGRLSRAAADEGFTLVELIVVIVIIGILGAIAAPVFLASLDQARVSSLQAAMASARLEVALVIVEQGTVPVGAQREAILAAGGDADITLELTGAGVDFCIGGAHALVDETWAVTQNVVPTRGAICGAGGTIVLP